MRSRSIRRILYRARCAKTGRFISAAEAKRRPKTSIIEIIKVK